MLTKQLLGNSKKKRMLLNVEYRYVTGASGVGVYLVSVPEIKDSIPERIAVFLIKLFFSYAIADFVSLWAKRRAYEVRGYTACGGEYILIAVSFVLAYYMVGIFFRYFRRTCIWEKEK